MKNPWSLAAAFVLSFALGSETSFAGAGSFSGGFGRVCFKNPASAEKVRTLRHLDDETLNDVQSVEVLDYLQNLERRAPDPSAPVLTAVDSTLFDKGPKEYIYRLSARLRYADYAIAQQLTCIMKNPDCDNIRFSTDFSKFDIDNDAGMEGSFDSPSCVVVALAVNGHKTSKVSENQFNQYEIIIFEPLFKKMDLVNQGVLYLHEILYIIGRKKGHENSAVVRDIVADLIDGTLYGRTVGALFDKLYPLYHPKTDKKRPTLAEFKSEKARSSVLYKKALPIFLKRVGSQDPVTGCLKDFYSGAFTTNPSSPEHILQHFCQALFQALGAYSTEEDHYVIAGTDDRYLTDGITTQQVLKLLESLVLNTEFQ